MTEDSGRKEPALLWTPSPERVAGANLTKFASIVADRHKLADSSYQSLYRWSVMDRAAFWKEVWEFCGVVASRPPDVVERPARDGGIRGTRWFEGSKLNFAENLLRHRGPGIALVSTDERLRRRTTTFDDLYAKVARLAHHFRAIGVRPGDRVAGFVPNCEEAVISMLAATACGAIWSSCSPEFGVRAVLERFGQIEPVVFVAHDGYSYAGKSLDSLKRIQEIVSLLPTVKETLIISSLEPDPDVSAIPRARRINDILIGEKIPPLLFEQLPFDHPIYILYSSGTTGAPKCIVHGAGGTLLQHLKELVLHTDLKPGSTIFYYTTCGWMMWNWLVSSLAVGATVVLYDGSPFHPSGSVLWDLCDREKIEIFGTSARYISALEKKNLVPRRSHSLSSLKTVLSTGSPLAESSFEYLYRDVKQDLCVSSISGGTDIVSCFALGAPTMPVYRGELQVRGLGMSVEVFNDEGEAIIDTPGELVCTAPFPSMPVFFWNDPTGEKYRTSYFSQYKDVWRHGDWALLTPRGTMVIYGRSDATLNPAGVRIGTAEIYRELEPLSEILESLLIGQPWDGDVRIVLFIKLREGVALDDSLVSRIRFAIRTGCSPRHVPDKIIAVPDIPRTISGKIVEIAVRDIVAGREIKNRDALANPEALEYFKNLPELKERPRRS